MGDCDGKVEYKIDSGSCGETCVSDAAAPFAEKFGGVTPGDCKSQGYTVFDHTESVSMGPFGTASIDIYNKPAIFADSVTTKCSGKAQTSLLYNVDKFTAADVGLPDGVDDESLADAICCDEKYAAYAEPNQFYAQPSIGLFRKLNKSGTTTFYDSVCGLPLFEAPIGRTLEEFEAETEEHGWPSFRTEEIVDGNVLIAEDGRNVYSKCGTKLGTNEPDDAGNRYCMDLSCIAGTNAN